MLRRADRPRGATTGSRPSSSGSLAAENERVDSRHNRYVISPQSLLAAQREARASGLDIVGYYHSHPDHPARPSEFDREHAWPGTSYVIVSVSEGKAVDCRSWRLRDDRDGVRGREPVTEIQRIMSLTIQIPTPLRRFTGEQRRGAGRGHDGRRGAAALVDRHAGAQAATSTPTRGKLRSFVNLFLNDEDVRYLKQENTPVPGGRHAVDHPVDRLGGGRAGAVVGEHAMTMVRDHEHAVLPQLTPEEISATAAT